MRSKMAIVTILQLVLILGLSACTKDREDYFAQTEGGKDLLRISDYDGRSFELKTGAVDPNGPFHVSKVGGTEIARNVEGFNIQSAVHYNTDAELLGNEVPFAGKSNSTYEIRYILTAKYLKVVKVLDKKRDIPFSEQDIAFELEDGKYAIPLVGYDIRYIRVEKQLNGDREETNVLREFAAKDKNEASHFRIVRESRQVFEPISKMNVFPVSLFKGDWYYAGTIIDAPEQSKGNVGANLYANDRNFTPSSKVRFNMSNPNQIRVVNVNVAEGIDLSNEVQQVSVLEIPTERLEFRTRRNGEDFALSEELVTNNPPETRPYIRVNFNEMRPLGNSTSNIQDLTITNNYLGFTLFNSGVRIHYSFMKESNRDYEPVRYHSDDRKLFGYFLTEKAHLQTSNINTKEDKDKMYLISRYNPKKDIKFYLTQDSPSKFWNVGNRCIKAWNDAFEKAGTGMKITLEKLAVDSTISHSLVQMDSSKKKLGDLRYNTLNFIDAVAETGLLGFGPKVTDPHSGEIISTSANIHVTNIRSITISNIRQYILSEIGMVREDALFDIDSKSSSPGNDVASSSSLNPISLTYNTVENFIGPNGEYTTEKPSQDDLENLASNFPDHGSEILAFPNILKRKVYSVDPDSDSENRIKEQTVYKNIKSNTFQGNRLDGQLFCSKQSMIGANLRRDIEEKCPEIKKLVQELNSNKDLELKTEIEIEPLTSCADKLLDDEILNVCVHEVGHNLGFRHNFKGSVDKDNFTVLENGVTARSSSIMEYSAQEDDLLTIPGHYDIAAIRFGYAGKVEIEGENISDSSNLVSLDRDLSILENMKVQNEEAAKKGFNWDPKIKKFLYCTDEDASYTLHDAQCARHDSGTSPLEMVKFHIDSINRIYNFRFHRFNRYRISSQRGLSNWIMESHYIPMKMLYDEWRFYLARYAGIGKGYLDLYDKEEFEKLLDDMSKDQRNAGEGKTFAEVYAEYRPAAVLAYEFLKEIVFKENRYCIVDNSGKKEAIELERVRFEVFRQESRSITTCAEGQSYLDSAFGVKLLEEKGYSLNDMKDSMDFRDFQEPNDIVGTMALRMNAIPTLMARIPLGIRHNVEGLLPNFFDEPAWREELQNLFVDRLVKGANIKSVDSIETQKRFHYERPLIELAYELLKPGLRVPGKDNTSNKRMLPFVAYTTRDQDQIKAALDNGGNVLGLPSGVRIVAPSASNTVALKMMDAYREYLNISAEPMNLSMFDDLKDFIETLPSKPVPLPAVTPLPIPPGLPLPGSGNPVAGQPAAPAAIGVTVEEFAKMVQGLNRITRSIPNFSSSISGKTSETIELINGLFQAIAQLIQSGQVKPEQIMSQDISILLPPGAEYPGFKDDFDELDKDIHDAVALSQDNYDQYLKDINDYEAQANIILQSLLSR